MDGVVDRRTLLPHPLNDGLRVSRDFFETMDSDDESILSDCPTIDEDDLALLYHKEMPLRYSFSSDEEAMTTSSPHHLISDDEEVEEGEITSDSEFDSRALISDDDSASDVSWK